ncbi:MAG: hypothetical protein CVU97_04435 [Firmicutes bacterium HGW-Firmicutes-21]|nr:MAG: hypothetical protein CVU97_04435 [Firmicutes bacterium HGW-Firmicutes-21]
MKRFLIIALSCVLLFSLYSCAKTGIENSDESIEQSDISSNEKTLTWAFYNSLDPSKMFITFETVTELGTDARFAQAISGENVTTVIDYLDNSNINDIYELYTPDTTYYLDVVGKKYSASNEAGQGNLFANLDKSRYNNADKVTTKDLDGVSYICEVFGNETNATNYYFDTETKAIYAVESVENGASKQIMRNIKVSSIIPENVVLSIPSDYRATTLTINEPIEWPWGDLD